MDRIYFAVKRTDPNKWKGLPYMTKVSGNEELHYDAESVLTWFAELITGEYSKHLVVFRDNLPERDKVLSEGLETMLKGHNMALRLKGAEARTEAGRILNSRKTPNS